MYDYTLAPSADESIYIAQVEKIKKDRPRFTHAERLADVDGSGIVMFHFPDGVIKVVFDTEVDATYVQSDMQIDELLVCDPFVKWITKGRDVLR